VPHPRAGEEDEFPPPDNPSKMRRSVENAEHVGMAIFCLYFSMPYSPTLGLFAPRSGQRGRDDQRDNRSQYDRGTRLAALEEFEYEDSMINDYGDHYQCK
jgi:hypothetical protein